MGSNLLVHGLAFLTLVFLGFFIILRVLSKHKRQAVGEPLRVSVSASNGKRQSTAERLGVNLPATCRTSSGDFQATFTQLSVGGGFVICPQPLSVGEQFEIALALEDREPLELRAEVLWNNNPVSAEDIVTRGMKIRFLQLSPDGRKIIETILHEHAKTLDASAQSSRSIRSPGE